MRSANQPIAAAYDGGATAPAEEVDIAPAVRRLAISAPARDTRLARLCITIGLT